MSYKENEKIEKNGKIYLLESAVKKKSNTHKIAGTFIVLAFAYLAFGMGYEKGRKIGIKYKGLI